MHEHKFLIPLGIYLELEFFAHMVTLYLTFQGTAKIFSLVAVLLYIHTGNVWLFHFIHILANVCCLFF